MKMSKMLGLAAVAGAAAMLAATGAQAHAKLVSSNPGANATVAAPKQLVLKFSEKLQPKFSGADVAMPGMVTPAKVSFAKDGKTMIVQPTAALMAGAYTVKWHAVTADTHRMQGTYSFTVR
ncbi:copper homeostasis periplasmic binding protein CopC [Phenylobacterium sp.]|uniref:copper homeostasis periplasmic binding protein CopC n=1 Tax=Phenylobacterium sp. TaxID=1871053 RepID=UPI0035640323